MAAETLPRGTLTLLFSDIEGSTQLLADLGPHRYGQVLVRSRHIVRSAVGAAGGREMGTEGDSFFVVFRSAAQAIAAAVQCQRDLTASDWPEGRVPRVRMGIHTGEPEVLDDGYVGMDLHRAARIAGAAHGGQVLLSDATWALVQAGLPAGVTGVDVGEHRLKDLPRPVRLYRLLITGTPSVDAPPRALGTTTNLPQPVGPLVGREAELATVTGFLAGDRRLVTLVGTGGVGKTRLAVEAAGTLADRWPDGVHFIALSGATTSGQAWSLIVETLPTPIDADSDVDPRTSARGWLATRCCLVVLDNLEQVPGAGELVAELLDGAPRCAVLATARQPLHVLGEQLVALEPLSVPEADATDPVDAPAVRLFLQHARRVRPAFDAEGADLTAVVSVCRALDGLPLALEIAAARLRLLGPRQLLAGLGAGLSLVAPEVDRPARHRTLRDTLAWSYELLGPAARRMLGSLSVAPAGMDLPMLAEVYAPAEGSAGTRSTDPLEVLSELVDASLVRLADSVDGEPRAGLLNVVREFAAETLPPGDSDELWHRFAAQISTLVTDLAGQLSGPHQVQALDRLKVEQANVYALLEWSLGADAPTEDRERVLVGLRTVVSLGPFWQHHRDASLGRHWLERAIAVSDGERGEASSDPHLRTAALRSLQSLAGILLRQGEPAAARESLRRPIAAWRALGNDELLAAGLSGLGLAYRVEGDLDAARAALEESVLAARRAGNPSRLAGSLTDLGIVTTDAGDPGKAADLFAEAIAVEEPTGDLWGPAVSRANRAVALLDDGRPDEALATLARVVPILSAVDDPELTIVTLEGLAAVLSALGCDAAAARCYGSAQGNRERVGLPIAVRDLRELDRSVGSSRTRLGEQMWTDAVATGAAATTETALRDALAAAERPTPA